MLIFDNSFWSLFAVPVALVCLLTVIGFLGQLWWFFDLASHFRGQYFLILIASSLIFLLGRQPRAAGGAAVFALINLAFVAPLYLRPSSELTEEHMYRLLLLNVLQRNRRYEKVRQLIRSTEPDIIILVETNRTWLDELDEILADYPYTQNATRNDSYGIALFSRIPFDEAEIHYFGEAEVPSVVARFRLGDRLLTTVGTHPPPPKGATNSAFRNGQLDALAGFAAAQQGEVILCGDLNMTPWSPYFWRLLRKSGLRNSARGFGIQPTWPSDRPLFRVPIDHCLVSPGVAVYAREIGPFVGSDHFPVILDFSFAQPGPGTS